MDWLIIAEKKSQADHFRNALFDKHKGSGNYQTTGVGGKDVSSYLEGEVRIMHFVGHIYEMLMPNEQDEKYDFIAPKKENKFGIMTGGGYKSLREMMSAYPVELDLDNIKWKASQSKFKSLGKNLEKAYKKASHVIVATDYDNEGEMIYMNWQTNHIKRPDYSKMSRLKVNVLTDDAIRHAIQNLIPYDNPPKELEAMRARGFARSISDYEYGLSFSYYGRQLARLKNQKPGQYGRLKNSILGVVYQQEGKHDNFVDSSKYRIDVNVGGLTLEGCDELVFETKAQAEEYLKNSYLDKSVEVKYKSAQKKESAPKLYSRNELIVHMNKNGKSLLRSGEKWGSVLQDLYETHVLLSYPRTDVQVIGLETYNELKGMLDDVHVNDLLTQRIKEVASKQKIQPDIQFNRDKSPEKKHVNDKALEGESHYALVPSGKSPKNFNSLTPAEQFMYKEDLFRTLAIFADNAEFEQRTYEVLGMFKSSFKRYNRYGYRILLDDCPENKHEFIEEGTYDAEYIISEVKAKRPPLFSVSSLLSMMKRVNWGTSATRDSTVDDMIKKGTFVNKKGRIRVNESLDTTVEELLNEELINFKLTSNWQEALDKIYTMDDAVKFIENNRKDTERIHEEFERLFDL